MPPGTQGNQSCTVPPTELTSTVTFCYETELQKPHQEHQQHRRPCAMPHFSFYISVRIQKRIKQGGVCSHMFEFIFKLKAKNDNHGCYVMRNKKTTRLAIASENCSSFCIKLSMSSLASRRCSGHAPLMHYC